MSWSDFHERQAVLEAVLARARIDPTAEQPTLRALLDAGTVLSARLRASQRDEQRMIGAHLTGVMSESEMAATMLEEVRS